MSNPDNPYLGLRPYTEQEQDRFFGRDSEIHILTDKILAHRLTLLVAASGVGKSSLLQAGVMPALRATGMADLVYHNDWALNPDADLKTSLVKHLIKKQRVTADYQADFTLPLAEFIRLHSLLCEGSLVILLDQFEEFFYYQRFSQQREPFIQELAGAIQDPQSAGAFVFAMREDFAMELQAFKPWFKGIFDNVYRIEKLDLNAAKEAICKPLDNIGFSLEPELLEQLLQDLGQRELKERLELPQQSDRQTELFVEPPHLQIVCQQLWLQAQTDADRQIKLGHYQTLGKTQGILTGYFRQKMALLKREQLRLASKAFDHLVSQHGTKRSFPLAELAELLDENESALQQTLNLLQEAVILRRVQRNSSYWYELYHDIFAKSINDWNRDYKLRQLRWKVAKGVAYALAASAILTLSIDGYGNYHNRYLQLGPETVSDHVELYQGEVGSWDLFHQQRFLYETDYVRWDIEADKRFQQQNLVDPEQTEIIQIGLLHLELRLAAFAKVGLFEKASHVTRALQDSKDDTLLRVLAKQQDKIRTIPNFKIFERLYREHPELTKGRVNSLLTITPRAEYRRVLNNTWGDVKERNATAKIERGNAFDALKLTLSMFKLQAWLDNKKNGAMHKSATETLSPINVQAAIPKQIDSLEDEDNALAKSVAQALENPNAQAATLELSALLDDKNDDVRRSAVLALGQLNAQTATPKLITMLEDKDGLMRLSAITALSQLDAQAAIPKLIALLEDQNEHIRESAAKALGRLNAHKAIPKLISLLEDKEEIVRWSTAEVLGQLNAQAAIPKLIALLGDKEQFVRRSATEALGQLNAQPAVPNLIALLEDEDEFVRGYAVTALGRLNAHAAIPRLIALLKEDEDELVRIHSITALGKLNAQAAIPKLIALLDDSVDQSAAEALGQLRARAAAPALLKLLTDKNGTSQQIAALALSRLQSKTPTLARWQDRRLSDLNAWFKTHSNRTSDFYYKVADFAYIVTPASVTELSSWLNDTDPNVLINSLNSLASIASIHPLWLENRTSRLIELTRYKHPGVQQAAINTLAQLITQQPNQSAIVDTSIDCDFCPYSSEDEETQKSAIYGHVQNSTSPSVNEQIRQTLTGLAQDSKLPDNLRLAAIDGLGNSKTEAAAAVLLTFSSDGLLQLRCLYWLAQMAYQPALPELKQGLAKLELEKQQWRQQVLDSKAQANETEALTRHEDKSWPNDYRVYQYAYSIARIDSQNAGIALLSHPLYAAREAAILALADQASGVLATKLVADLQAFNPEDLPSPRPYAAYRALDLLLQQVEFSGNQDDLAALSKLVEVEVELPMTTQQQAVNERLSWTVAELKARLDEQAGH